MLAQGCIIAEDTSIYPSDHYAILFRIRGQWRKMEDFGASSLDVAASTGLKLWNQSLRMG